MNGELKPGQAIEATYARLVLRVFQREDCLRISVYDSGSAQPGKPVWEGESKDLEGAKGTARVAAVGYFTDHRMYLIQKGDKDTARAAASGRMPILQPTLDWRKITSTDI